MSKILELENVSMRYRDFLLGNISFSLDEGIFLGLVGPNGAGKTTLIKMLLGITSPESGTIQLFGKDLTKNEAWCKNQIGFVLGESRFWETLNPKELGSALSLFYKDWDKAEYASLLDRFEISPTKKAAKLSTGMKTRLYLATALSHHAKLLILDEPTSGLDPFVRHEVVSILCEYLAKDGTSVIFSSHITSDLDRNADYLLFLLNGKNKYYGALDAYVSSFAQVRSDPASLDDACREKLIGLRETATVSEGITADPAFWDGRANCVSERAELEDILIAVTQEDKKKRAQKKAEGK